MIYMLKNLLRKRPKLPFSVPGFHTKSMKERRMDPESFEDNNFEFLSGVVEGIKRSFYLKNPTRHVVLAVLLKPTVYTENIIF